MDTTGVIVQGPPSSSGHTAPVDPGSPCGGSSQIPPTLLVPAHSFAPAPTPAPTPTTTTTTTTTDIGVEVDLAYLQPSDPPLPSYGLSSAISTRETSVPIDPVLLGISYPWLAEPLPQPVLQEQPPFPQSWRRPVSLKSDSGAEPATKESEPVLPPPTSTPAFNFVDSPPSPHVSTSTLVTTRPHIPSDWPKHMVDAYRYLTEEPALINGETRTRNWGILWLLCLQAFVDFQQRAGFPDGGPSFPPSTSVRPREISVWMKNGRRWTDVDLDDTERFGKQWWDWWHSLQPKSRIRRYQSRSTSPTLEMDWSGLQKPGKNGILLVMISLVWWGSASSRDESWLAAIVDVTEVLTCMKNASGEMLGESSVDNSASAVTSKRGRRGDSAATGEPLKKRYKGR